MKVLSRGVLAAALSSALLAAPAFATDVTVRVEGASGTLVPETAVSLPGPAVDKTAEGGTTCTNTSGGSALETATAADWGGRKDSQGQRVERIKGETHLLGGEYAGVYWSIYVNDKASFNGICNFDPQQADEILLYPACGGASTGCYGGEPLDFKAPRRARPGEAFTASVQEITTDYNAGTTSETPSQDATITGGGVSATTGADGKATITLTQRGENTLTARKGDRVPESQTVCVTDGADGFCGTAKPGQTTSTPPPSTTTTSTTASSCVTTGRDGFCGTPDGEAPKTLLEGIRDGQRFSRARAPRVLRGQVGVARRADFRTTGLLADPSGVAKLELRLTRTGSRRRCSRYDARRERFVAVRRCGARGPYFLVGDRAPFEYQLPGRLPRGRYVLDARATDRAGNRDDQRRRGENRVVFFVR